MFLFYLADFYLKSIREIFTRFPLTDRKFYFHEISKFETNIIYNTYIKSHFCCVYLNNIRYSKFKNFIYILWKIIKKIYRIKIERAKEGEGILSREEDAQQIADLSSAMQMLYLRRKYQAKKRTGTSGSRKFVDGAPWFINEKFDPVVTERPALISSENPARNSKNSNSTSTRSPSRENCQTAILVTHRLVFAPIPSSPSSPFHHSTLFQKEESLLCFLRHFFERKATKNFIKILTNFEEFRSKRYHRSSASRANITKLFNAVRNFLRIVNLLPNYN